ncbi:MAG TPA: RsmD family RNA methyltransferase, partial [Nitrospirota bacterium]|nr:RsmD family RNA methyltransferase [Nitrospirota bacterium]
VFVDPPYHEEAGQKTMEMLGEAQYLTSGAAVVFEHHKKYPAPESFGELVKKKDYTYGDTVLSVYFK